jgi:hypothetical protein
MIVAAYRRLNNSAQSRPSPCTLATQTGIGHEVLQVASCRHPRHWTTGKPRLVVQGKRLLSPCSLEFFASLPPWPLLLDECSASSGPAFGLDSRQGEFAWEDVLWLTCEYYKRSAS